MANVNRYVEGRRNVRLVNVASGVTVEIGDLMFLDNSDNLRSNGSSSANYYAYPISYLRISGASLTLNKAEVKARFLGVALDDKTVEYIPSGIFKISIATTGKFNFDLSPGASVNNGSYFGPSGTTTGSDMFNQKVAKTTNSDLALGYFAEYKINANSADVWIRTAFGSGGSI